MGLGDDSKPCGIICWASKPQDRYIMMFYEKIMQRYPRLVGGYAEMDE